MNSGDPILRADVAGPAVYEKNLTGDGTKANPCIPGIALYGQKPDLTYVAATFDSSGNLQVTGGGGGGGGAVTQSGTWNVGLTAGSNLVGKVGIDQTTPGTTNKVDIGTNGTVTVNALPAGTALIGKVGIDQTTPGTTNKVSIGTDGTVSANLQGSRVQVTPAITASSAYASGNNVGPLMTIANAVPVAAGSSILQSVSVFDKSKQNAPLILTFFASNPTNSTFTDKTAQTVNVADGASIIGFVRLTDYNTFAGNSIGEAPNLGKPIIVASGQTIYAVAQTTGTPTWGSTSDLIFTFNFTGQ